MKDLFSIEGKVALVTGGSSGIGRMIARGYVEAGARVYIASRKQEACDETAAELSRVGTCVGIAADLGSEGGARGLAETIAARESALHVLVNNAGANWAAPLAEYPEAGWDKVMNLNVKGVFHLTRLLVPLLEKAANPGNPARVINVGSVDGIQVPGLEIYAYAASKAAVHHLTRVLAKRLAPTITVNAIAPGPFESKMMAETLTRFRETIVAGVPLGRIGEPEDMAGIAILLASRAGAWITGAVVPVDGGTGSAASRTRAPTARLPTVANAVQGPDRVAPRTEAGSSLQPGARSRRGRRGRRPLPRGALPRRGP
jgi:NAD(P)-dependent dehydrogenase (short-subunit alcohol dehydrogenase family)